MKKILFLTSFVFILSNLRAQVAQTGGELNFDVFNNYNHKNVTIIMEPVELFPGELPLRWNTDHSNVNIHDLIMDPELYDGGTLVTTQLSAKREFLFVWETTIQDEYRTFAIGLYKVTVKVNDIIKDYFTIDYRTSSLPELFNCSGSGDINLDFDVSVGEIWYDNTNIPFPSATSIWAEKPCITNLKTELEPLPPDNFQLTSSSGYPYLSWNHSSNSGDYLTGYEIYRSVVSGQGTPPGQFIKIANVGANSTNFTDYELNVGGPLTAYYKVSAKNGTRISNYTPTLNIRAGFNKNSIVLNNVFELRQNYPNPFNANTKIAYQVPKNSFVNLAVTDILGNKVAELVNEQKEPGLYEINFDASNLPTGNYFYILRADNFVNVKKLILLK